MTILGVVRDVCANVGVVLPTTIFSGITGNRTMQEMVALANEEAQSIAYDRRDWTRFKTTVTFVGDGVSDAFDLPENYKRMLLTSNVWRSTSTQQPMNFIPDADTWLQRRLQNWIDTAWGEWTIIGGQMHIWPIMEAANPAAGMPAATATFVYIDKNCIGLASGGAGNFFMSDNDSFLLDERLLKLRMIWKWKSNKGSPYQEDLSNYEDALASVEGRDSPAPIIMGRPISRPVWMRDGYAVY